MISWNERNNEGKSFYVVGHILWDRKFSTQNNHKKLEDILYILRRFGCIILNSPDRPYEHFIDRSDTDCRQVTWI